MNEWPLIIFTTLIQISIGCYLLTVCYAALTKDTSKLLLPFMTSAVIAMAGLFASIFHLGNPWNILNTINNVATSWMSREVLFVGGYAGLLALAILHFLFTKSYHRFLLAVTAVIGVCAVFVMSNIYISSLFVLWAGWVTYSSFWATTLIAGGLAACLAFNISLNKETQADSMKKIIRLFFIFAFIAVVLDVSAYLFLQNNMLDNATRAISAKYVDSEALMTLTSIKAVLLFFSLIIMFFIKNQVNKKITSPAITVACVLVVFAELVGRYSFFSLTA